MAAGVASKRWVRQPPATALTLAVHVENKHREDAHAVLVRPRQCDAGR